MGLEDLEIRGRVDPRRRVQDFVDPGQGVGFKVQRLRCRLRVEGST